MGNPMQDETPATPPTCPPVVCPDWCTSTTGHAEEDLVADQRHTGSNHHVTLSREELLSYGRTSQMEYVSVQSETEDGPDSPLCVSLAIGELAGIKLTHGEALALMAALSRSAGEIDPDRESVQKSRGEGLKIAREGFNISIEDFAAHMGESPADMRAYEAGVCMTGRTASVLTRCLATAARKRAA